MIALSRHPTLSLLVVMACVAVAGCALKVVPPPKDDPVQIQAAWNQFQANFGGICLKMDFSVRGSVNFTSADRGSRLLFSFWGHTHFPVRMDLQAGVGTMLALWREDETGWIGYHPGQEKAYQATDSRTGAKLLGLTMPLRLDALAQVLSGCWGKMVPSEYAFAHTEPDGFVYQVRTLHSRAELLLSPDGVPLALRVNDPQSWSIIIHEWMTDQSRSPKRLHLRQQGSQAHVRVQRLELADKLWQPDDLTLKLPPETLLVPLAVRP